LSRGLKPLLLRVVGFDEGAEAVEGGVPLAGEGVEVVFKGLDGEGVELVEAFAAGVGAADDAGSFEDAEMLGDGLAGDRRAFSELGYRPLLAVAKLGQQRETRLVAEGGEERGVAARTWAMGAA
jgi:hypothetical protein